MVHSPAVEELPTAFGKYFLSERIATGGMAEIYLAKLIGPGGFEKQLVIKQISPALSTEPAFVDLFVAEAKTLVSLSHGNIVPIYELGVVDDTYFIAMEYVDGPPLADLLRGLERSGERMSPGVAAFIAVELLDGLGYAHRKGDGVIHRDVSPRNVLCSREGEVKLVDFGIAVASGARQRGGLPAGSFPYMSPEQVRGEALDRQSDVFSAGAVLWELITGAPLFARATADDTLEAVLSAEVPPPSSRAPGVPSALDAICARALARDRAERYPTAGEFHAALGRHLYSLDTPVTASTLAALVSRVCPAVPRSAPGPDPEPDPDPELRDPPVSTRVMPKKRRAPTVQTFATSVAFASVLKNATPLVPFSAIPDPVPVPVPEPVPAPVPVPVPGRRRAPLLLAALVALAAFAATTLLVLARRDDTPRPPPAAAATATDPAPHPGPGPDPGPGPGPDPAPVPATAPDAAPLATPAPASRPDAAPRRPAGRGHVAVGANPWADVYVDGALVGQAPGSFPVAAGRRTVELRFRDQRRRFEVAVVADQTTTIDTVDFTAP
jgi:eukaryotic-like serine/threonine-protein kinase